MFNELHYFRNLTVRERKISYESLTLNIDNFFSSSLLNHFLPLSFTIFHLERRLEMVCANLARNPRVHPLQDFEIVCISTKYTIL